MNRGDHDSASEPPRRLSTSDGISILVGTVVGSGIFAFPALVAGGIISLLGAFCYAELATTYPDAGGDYHFLRRAFGMQVGFLFGWARMTVIQTGAIAAAAFIAGNYLTELLPLGSASSATYAALIVAALTTVNLVGLHASKWTQNVLVIAITLGLAAIIFTGFWTGIFDAPAPPSSVPSPQANSFGMISLALIFVLFTFGGWNEAVYLSADIDNPRRNMNRVLIIGIAIVTGLYMLVNLALITGLGHAGMASSGAVAADLLRRGWGEPGAVFISLLVLVAVLSTVNATIITGGRSNFALGRDYVPIFGFLGKRRPGSEVPTAALILQGAITIGLILLVPIAFPDSGLEAMVAYTAPVFWFFFLLAGWSVVMMRRRDPQRERPFRAPIYPLAPFLFCGVCL
jgi:APA family basic amino acid/polyamine antiporter